ncbi:protein YIPF5-like protein [Cucumis melo var. makuwa]|uniref:Protein YIP n=1 Tax=Cucumis melo var. makuwa TaxID=1194695 RepID=A0A5D3DNR0_CUCMM|nr:protein YIPF5-like protein [Cucumis melo var. makuwa]TYK25245.1 protein YIPF5-like protein [Cucumis melo var. makuwa]
MGTVKKEFAVPPVVFPSGGNPNLQQRRGVATAPFQPPRQTGSSIPFMSFDIGSAAAASTSSGSIYGGPIGGGSIPGGANFEDEEPLLDELGIHPDQIWKKTKSILNPFRVKPDVHKDSDLSGPILLYMFFGLFQLLAGKIQFGVILGWIVVSSIFLYVVFNMLAGRNGNLNLHTCTSVVGYCMLPVVVLSAVSLFLPQAGLLRFAVAGVFVLWATRICTSLMVSLADGGDEHRGLIAVPMNNCLGDKAFLVALAFDHDVSFAR